jgi:N-acetyl-anhydromuramyl-L-alanine amidase AmpD
MKKPFPNRYPFNEDSIGIENVSLAKNGVFEPLTKEQQTSLTWLLTELTQTLAINQAEIFRHSEVSWKLESEGASANLLDRK